MAVLQERISPLAVSFNLADDVRHFANVAFLQPADKVGGMGRIATVQVAMANIQAGQDQCNEQDRESCCHRMPPAPAPDALGLADSPRLDWFAVQEAAQ